MLHGEPTAREREEHKTALKWLLRLTRLYLVAVEDPDFPDPSARKELRGRLRQLEDSWIEHYDTTVSEEETHRVLAEVFPDEPRA